MAKNPLKNAALRTLRDSGILGILSINFRDMGIQGFLIFLDICHFFRDMGYFPEYLKRYEILGPPSWALYIHHIKELR